MLQICYKKARALLQIAQTNLKQLFREGEIREILFYLEKEIKNSKMEDLSQLRLKKKMLELELQALMGKITLLENFQQTTMVIDEPESSGLKSKTSPEQTVSGKDSTNPFMDVVFPKSKKEIVDFQSTTSPVQTETGKDKSTPLIPVALVKSKLAELPKETCLRPSWQDILQNKNISQKDERFYVVYNGKEPGIYTNWGIVEKIVSGNSTSFKKFCEYCKC